MKDKSASGYQVRLPGCEFTMAWMQARLRGVSIGGSWMYLAGGGIFVPTSEVMFRNDAYVCCGRYWIEFVPVEDRFGAACIG